MSRPHFVVIHGGNGTGPQMEPLAAAVPCGSVAKAYSDWLKIA